MSFQPTQQHFHHIGINCYNKYASIIFTLTVFVEGLVKLHLLQFVLHDQLTFMHDGQSQSAPFKSFFRPPR